MKYLNKFNENINSNLSIEELCKKYISKGSQYVIKNGLIYSDTTLVLDLEELDRIPLPLKFGEVQTMFIDGNITSLENSPTDIGFAFNIVGCHELTSLVGAPNTIGTFLHIRGIIDDIKGLPKPRKDKYVLTSLGYESNINNVLSLFLEVYSKGTSRNDIVIDHDAIDLCELFVEFDPIRRGEIVLDRLNDFLETIGKPSAKLVEGYKMI